MTDFLTGMRFSYGFKYCQNLSEGQTDCQDYFTDDSDFRGAMPTAADFDGDGDLDVVAVGLYASKLMFCPNDGNENFTACQKFDTPGSAQIVESGDLDGDGDPDVLIGGFRTTMRYCLNDYDADTGVMSWSCSNLPEYGTAHFIDMNGDGILEIVSEDQDGANICHWDNGYTCGPLGDADNPGYSHAIGDFDGDGYDDVFLSGFVSSTATNPDVCFGSPTGSYSCEHDPTLGIEMKTGRHGADAGDLDRDGYLDVVVTANPEPYACYGSGDGTFVCEVFPLGKPNCCGLDGVYLEEGMALLGPIVTDSDGDGVPDDSDVCPGYDDNADSDSDTIPDGCDSCPYDADNDADGDGVCGDVDQCSGDDASGDSDGDLICDDIDLCYGDNATGDADDDGVCNDQDDCTGDDATGDSDNDGICDSDDLCSGDDATGDSDGDLVCDDLDICLGDDVTGDSDSDGLCDDSDACPLDADNDADGDGVCGDVDLCLGDDATGDSDNDDVCDDQDLCQGNDAAGDDDLDGWCSDIDNCPDDANADQDDADGDEIGDVCELDSDGDGVIDDYDNCIDDFNTDQTDTDFDGAGDVCDNDDDGDGVEDLDDNCPLHGNADQADFDGDGSGDLCDGDDDADGIGDDADLCPQTPIGAIYDDDGCSGPQFVELTCGNPLHQNHGEYVSCVAHASKTAQRNGLLTSSERALIVREAAQSNKPKKSKK